MGRGVNAHLDKRGLDSREDCDQRSNDERHGELSQNEIQQTAEKRACNGPEHASTSVGRKEAAHDVQDVGRYWSVEVAQRGIIAVDVERKPRMLAEFRVGTAPVKQFERSDAIGIEPGSDNRRLRGAHVVCRIVKQDAVLRLREMEEKDEQGDNQSPEEA